ncbi:hypothetical protein CF327_g3895 [Tilletia walkeri]|nr:hypothetical protein CF327_g3895 [Tilletia walkeri]
MAFKFELTAAPLLTASLSFSAVLLLYFGFLWLAILKRNRALRHCPQARGRFPPLLGAEAAIHTHPDGPHILEIIWMRRLQANVLTYPSLLGSHTLFIADPLAAAAASALPMTELESRIARMFLGDGIVTSTPASATHRYMRKALAAPFSSAAIASLSPIFVRHAQATVDAIQERLKSARSSLLPLLIDIVPMLNAAAFDILADAGLGYESGCIESLRSQWNDDTRKCKDALAAAFDSTNAVFAGQHPIAHVLLTLLGYLIPPLSSSSIFARNRAIKTNRRRMEKLGLQMIEDRQSSSDEELVASGHIDIVSRLLFAAGRRLGIAPKSDKEVLVAQINAFLFAGHETTASTLSWLILSLTRHQAFQIRLARNIEHLHLDQAASDPIIEATVKEVLRLYPASRVLRRVADSEVILPLSEPLRGNQNGEDGKNPGDPRKLVVPKEQNIVIGLAAMNRIKSIWGEDADEFNPYRFFALPDAHELARLPYDLASFGFGPKTCLGARFVLMELKILTAALVQNFHFSPVPHVKIVCRQGLFFRPVVQGEEHMGPQLPVLITPREHVA